jgi:hypothetical protein
MAVFREIVFDRVWGSRRQGCGTRRFTDAPSRSPVLRWTPLRRFSPQVSKCQTQGSICTVKKYLIDHDLSIPISVLQMHDAISYGLQRDSLRQNQIDLGVISESSGLAYLVNGRRSTSGVVACTWIGHGSRHWQQYAQDDTLQESEIYILGMHLVIFSCRCDHVSSHFRTKGGFCSLVVPGGDVPVKN